MNDGKEIINWLRSEEFIPKNAQVIAGASYYDNDPNPMVFKRNVRLDFQSYRDLNPYLGVLNYAGGKDWEIELELRLIIEEILNEKFSVEVESIGLSGDRDVNIEFIYSSRLTGAIRLNKVNDENDQWDLDVVLSVRK